MKMSRLTRDGTAEPVSRDQILRHARGQGNIPFPCSADHEQDWQPYPVDPYSAICDDYTYIHTYILASAISLLALKYHGHGKPFADSSLVRSHAPRWCPVKRCAQCLQSAVIPHARWRARFNINRRPQSLRSGTTTMPTASRLGARRYIEYMSPTAVDQGT